MARELLGLKFKKLSPNAVIPSYGSSQAAGLDISNLYEAEIQPGESMVFATGIAVELPEGYEIQVRGRSGLAFNDKVFAFNGTIDSDYRGEIKVLLINHSKLPITVNANSRIAQLVPSKIERMIPIEIEELSATGRGISGFGSTGLAATLVTEIPDWTAGDEEDYYDYQDDEANVP